MYSLEGLDKGRKEEVLASLDAVADERGAVFVE
jgi:hypothetical protein